MRETSARLLRLLGMLQSRPDWSGSELARELDVTERTVRRDVERLRDLGYPVHAVPGVAGGYRLGAGGKLPPLLLDDDEAVAAAVGLRSAAGYAVAGLGEASLRALSKLEQVLPAQVRHRVVALQTSTVPLPSIEPAVESGALVAIAEACRACERLRFGYRDRDGHVSDRLVEPHRLVHTGRRWYLVARDTGREAWRAFRIDRIDAVTATGWRFTPGDVPDAAAFVADAVSTAPYRNRARVRMHAPTTTVAERVSPTAVTVEALDEHTCEVRGGAGSLDAIALHLALLDIEFDVLEPPELADRMRILADRLARAAQQWDAR